MVRDANMAFLLRGGPTSPQNEPVYASNPLSPARNSNRLSGGMMMTGGDVRGALTRRFTTNALPTLTPIGQQRKQAAGEYAPAGYSRNTPSESAVRRYESLLAAQRELQRELDKVDPETRREVEEGLRHEDSITQMMASSEPTSPPEYANAFPSAFSRPQRYSTTSLTSPPGIATRPNRSSTQLTSPPAGLARPYTSGNASTIPSQSVPGSRRQSDDEEDDYDFISYDTAIHRAAANPNRNSMPITSYDRKRNGISVLGPVNTTGFLFDDDSDERRHKPAHVHSKSTTTSPPDAKTLLHYTADGFPKLVRREENGELSSAALDLAFLQGVEPQQQAADRATATRHRVSLPPTALSGNVNIAPLNSILANAENKSAANNRRSVEVKFSAETKRPALLATPPRPTTNCTQKPLSSYSTNDLPTLKSMHVDPSPGVGNDHTSPEQTAGAQKNLSSNHQSQEFMLSQYADDIHTNGYTSTPSLLQPNAVPFGPMAYNPGNQAQNFGQAVVSPYASPYYHQGGYAVNDMNGFQNAFSGMSVNGMSGMNGANGVNGNNGVNGYGGAPGQWTPQMTPHMTPLMTPQMPLQMPVYQQQGYLGAHQPYHPPGGHTVAGAGRYNDVSNAQTSQQRMTVQQRREANNEAQKHYNNITVEQLPGQIYRLCKDQHGCRFLQRKLDERSEQTTQLIFAEVKDHIVELMTDPFGNYLCQKLLESTNDNQRTVLIKNAMPAMTKIALNQHGTRALQKMIEFISTAEQKDMIRDALQHDVVQLIQDLNGNHVIQKCLNHLTPEDAQFIFEAVGANCVTVGTHRHGCCVLQRCIDHATGLQKGSLVDAVIQNAFALVQDPFGNYVVQYILDLSEPSFTEPLCQSFLGNMLILSKQKFSSNVIEKCIRCAGPDTRRDLIHEISKQSELERLLRDSFANYVVQTAMDFGDEAAKANLIENIRPILPGIRHTPYGRRIVSKIQEYDARNSGAASGITTPHDTTNSPNGAFQASPENNLPYVAQSAPVAPPVGRGNRQGWVGPQPQQQHFGADFGTSSYGGFNGHVTNGSTAGPDIVSPSPQRHNNTSSMFPDHSFSGPAAFTGQGRPQYGGQF